MSPKSSYKLCNKYCYKNPWQKYFIHDFRLDTFGRRSFQYAGPRNWRDLPPILQTKQSLNSFKEQLKFHLFKKDC